MLARHKHIVHYSLYCEYRSTFWWKELASHMSHLLSLTLCVHERKGVENVEAPYALTDLPNLTLLRLFNNFRLHTSYTDIAIYSVTLLLPALKTLELDDYIDGDHAKELRALDFQCPALVSIQLTIHKGLTFSPSIFENLVSLTMTIYNVSANIEKSGIFSYHNTSY